MKELILIIWMILILGISGESQTQINISGERFSEEDISEETMYLTAQQKKILGKYDEALEILSKLVDKNEVNPAIHHEMAKIYLKQEDQEKAISSARKAVRYAPENKWYLLTLVDIYESALEYELAAASLGQVIKVAPTETLFHRQAQNLELANKKNEALTVYDAADERYGWDAFRSDSKVDVFLSMDNEKRAIEEVKKWVDKDPEDISAQVKLARFYEFLGNKKKAIATYKDVLKLDPEHEEALFKTTQTDQGRTAETSLSQLVNDPRIGIDNKIKALLPYLKDGANLKELEMHCVSLVRQYPENAKAYALFGDVLWLSDDVAGSISQYEESLARNKSVYQVWDQLMMALLAEKKYDHLFELSLEALDYYPNQAGPYYYNAVAQYTKGNIASAKEMNEEAAFIAGGTDNYIGEQSLILRATLLDSGGASKEALELLTSIPDEDMTAPLLELLGDLYLKNGDKPAAETAWKKSLERGGDKARIEIKIQSI